MSDLQRLRQMQMFDINSGTPLMQEMGGYQNPPMIDIGMGSSGGGPTNPNQGVNPNVMPMQLPPVRSGNVDPNQSYQNMIDAINKIYTPSTVDRDRNRSLLDNYPVMQEPSGTSRWTAALMGLGARNGNGNPLDTMDRVLLSPHIRDVEDWKNKAQPFGQAAQMENTANINERNLANNVITQQRLYQSDAEKSRIADEKLKTERLRSEAYAFKQMHPTWKFDFSGPIGFAYNPVNPQERINLGPTGQLSDIDKINLQGKWNVEAAATRSQGATERAEMGGWTTYQQGDKTFRFNTRTGEAQEVSELPQGTLVKPGTARPAQDKPITAKEDEAQQQNRWRELYNTNPTARKHLREQNGKLVLDKGHTPGWMPWSDGQSDVDEHDAILKQLYPNYQAPQTGSPAPKTGPVVGDGAAETGKVSPMSRQQQQQGVQSGQLLEVIDASGKPVGTVPNSAAGRAEAARLGYKVR